MGGHALTLPIVHTVYHIEEEPDGPILTTGNHGHYALKLVA